MCAQYLKLFASHNVNFECLRIAMTALIKSTRKFLISDREISRTSNHLQILRNLRRPREWDLCTQYRWGIKFENTISSSGIFIPTSTKKIKLLKNEKWTTPRLVGRVSTKARMSMYYIVKSARGSVAESRIACLIECMKISSRSWHWCSLLVILFFIKKLSSWCNE